MGATKLSLVGVITLALIVFPTIVVAGADTDDAVTPAYFTDTVTQDGAEPAEVVVAAMLSGLNDAVAGGPADDPLLAAFYAAGSSRSAEVISEGTVTTAGEDVTRLRGLSVFSIQSSSDPRLSGISSVVLGRDEHGDLAAPLWGTLRTENRDGYWEGSMLGLELPRDDRADVPVFIVTLIGHDGYEGLSAICHLMYPERPDWGSVSECIVFPAEQPTFAMMGAAE